MLPRCGCAVLLFSAGCLGTADPTLEEGSPASVQDTLRCGATIETDVNRLGWFDTFGSGDTRGTQYLSSTVDQYVTVQVTASYDADFGVRLSAWDDARRSADDSTYYGTSARVRLWLDAGATLKVLVWPYSNTVRDGSDLQRGRWVDRNKDASGSYRIRVDCGGAVACEAPEGSGTCERTTRCGTGPTIPGLCPGPRDVQCCVTSPAAVEAPPDEQPAGQDDANAPVDDACTYAECILDEWCDSSCCANDPDCATDDREGAQCDDGICVDGDGWCDEGSECCPYDPDCY